MKHENAEKLFKKGLISEETYQLLVKKYADGGMVKASPLKEYDPVQAAIDPNIVQAQILENLPSKEQMVANDLESAKDVQRKEVLHDRMRLGRAYVPEDMPSEAALESAALKVLAEKKDEKESQQYGEQLAAQAQVKADNENRAKLGLPVKELASAVSAEPMVTVTSNEPATQQPAAQTASQSAPKRAPSTQASPVQQAVSTYGSAIMELDNEANKLRALRETQEADRNNYIKTAQQSLQRRLDDLDKVPDVDPNRLWNNKSTGSKILAGISMILGGKDAVNIVQGAIDRDIEAQKAAYVQRMGKTDAARGIYADMFKMYNDTEQAEMASRIAISNIIGKKLDAFAAQTSNQMQLMNYNLAKEKLNLDKQQLMMDFMRRSGQLYGQTGSDRISSEIFQKVPEEYRKQAIEERGNFEGMKSATDSIAKQFDEFKDIGSVASVVPFTQSQTDAETIQASLLANVVKSLGANPSDRDMKVIERLLPSKLDRVEQVQAKKLRMLQFVKQKQKELKPTPTLNQFGVQLERPINFTPVGGKRGA